MVSRPGRRERAPVGARAGNQAANAAGILWAADDVVRGRIERAVPPERGPGQHADHISSLRRWGDSRRVQEGHGWRMASNPPASETARGETVGSAASAARTILVVRQNWIRVKPPWNSVDHAAGLRLVSESSKVSSSLVKEAGRSLQLLLTT